MNSIVIAALLCGSTAAAQEFPVLRLTLAEAQARAVQVSHRLAEGRARETAARATVDTRRVTDHPIVSVAAGYTRTNHVLEFTIPSPTGTPRVLYPDAPDNYRTRLDLQWPIYNGGRTDALERAAAAEAAAAGADLEAARKDLRSEVARSFWALVTARAAVGVVGQGVARAEAHLRDARARFDAGIVPPNETASADAQVSRARMLLIEATNQRDLAEADLMRLVGAGAPIGAIEPVAELEAAGVDGDVAPALASLIAGASASRDERQAIARRVDAADAYVSSAAAARRPTIAVTAGADYARPNPRIFPRAERWDDSWDAGVAVTWPLWDGGRADADVAQATALAAAARHRLAEFDSLLGLEVRQRTLELSSGRAAVRAAGDLVRAAAEAQRVVTERYRAGVISQVEVLDAEQGLLQAELDRTRALAGVRLAEARLARATGR